MAARATGGLTTGNRASGGVAGHLDLVGERIRRLVEGEAALAFDGKGNLLLEDRIKPTE